MSYEGYVQNLCQQGHLFETDAHAEEALCPNCESPPCWRNSVDQTNGEELGFISDKDWEKFLRSPQETKVCDLGHTHITKPATYAVPTEEEANQVRSIFIYWEDPPRWRYLHESQKK